MSEKNAPDWRRILLFLIACSLGMIAFFFGGGLIHQNKDAIGIITTVFSIFAGFVVAITTILGTPVTDTEKQSWRTLELRRDNVFRRLTRQKWLFAAYMLTLSTIFLQTLLVGVDNPSESIKAISSFLERAFLGLAVFAFILSFGLPGALIKIQLARYDEMIEDKKKQNENN